MRWLFVANARSFSELSAMKADARPKKPLNLSVDRAVYQEFEKIAEAEHMEPSRFAALLISKFSDLKQGHALHALASIPKEHFKLRPGRVSSTASGPDLRLVGAPADHPGQ